MTPPLFSVQYYSKSAIPVPERPSNCVREIREFPHSAHSAKTVHVSKAMVTNLRDMPGMNVAT
jgi:hypothetical protein